MMIFSTFFKGTFYENKVIALSRTGGQEAEMHMKVLSVRYFLLIAMACFASLVSQPSYAEEKMPIVVELFTSQGCSSCPPADRLLGELVKQPGVIALTEAVDYWDYLGWKDSNARHSHTERQQDYARFRGDGRVYTPQMVINGRVHVVGSRRGDVIHQMNNLKIGSGALSIPVSAIAKDDALKISIAAHSDPKSLKKEGTVYVVWFKDRVEADIRRGENRGRKIAYHNVVQAMRPVGMWKGEALSIDLPMREVRKAGYDGCAILLQADVGGLPGPIYGAALVEIGG